MTEVQIEAGTVECALDTRTVTGLLVPYGETGRTNLGRFRIPKGHVTLPRDPAVVGGNLQHKREFPVARATSLQDTDAGVVASFKIADTDDGDQLLLDIEAKRDAGAPMKLSAEIRNIVLRAGELVSGTLFGAAFVEKGAFPSAALMAKDAGTEDTYPKDTESSSSSEYTDANGKKWTAKTTSKTHVEKDDNGNLTTTITDSTVLEEPEPPAQEEGEPLMGAAVVPDTLETEPKLTPSALSFHQVMNILDRVSSKTADDTMLAALASIGAASEDTLFAALTDIKLTTAGGVGAASGMLQPQWVGELAKLANKRYKQKFLPLFAHADLTSFTINAFHWTTEFAGSTWSGDKAAIPSNAPATAADTTSAARFGGAWDVAREFRDFSVPGFWEALYSQSARSYLKWADAKVLTDALAGATDLTADNPSGLAIGAGWSALIDGAVAVVDADLGLPEFAIVESSLYKGMLKLPADDILGYLNAALGLDAGTLQSFSIRPSSALTTGHVLVGVGEAMTVYELPGVPIRAEGLDMTKGGIDPGLFGYCATLVDDATGLVDVAPYVAP